MKRTWFLFIFVFVILAYAPVLALAGGSQEKERVEAADDPFSTVFPDSSAASAGSAAGSAAPAATARERENLETRPFAKDRLLNLGPYKRAVFAGGCFWCLERPFEELVGVAEVISGYTGGDEPDPSYDDVVSGRTGHLEAVKIYYNPEVITFDDLLSVFWRNIDPTDAGGQFADRGAHYATAIFYRNPSEREAAAASKQALGASGLYDREIVTELLPAGSFYPAEEYHQDYYQKQAAAYRRYYYGSGRGGFIENMWQGETSPEGLPTKAGRWGNFNKEEELSSLTELQIYVTRHNGTEKPFDNTYWDHTGEGIYVDVVSGEPLFSSIDKYDSGTGWPSFTRPLHPDYVIYYTDNTLGQRRIEARSLYADSHLGHVFEDGPAPTRLRYCINSAALRFVPKEEMAREGYAQYLVYF